MQFDDYGLFLKIIEWSIHNLVHVVHPGRHALVTLPHAENLFVKEGVGGGLHGLESGGLVGEGLLGHGGDSVDGVGGVWEAVAAVEQLRGAVCRHGQDRENNLTEMRAG